LTCLPSASTSLADASPARDRLVTAGSIGGYEVRFQAAARRSISEQLPEPVAAAVLEFCGAELTTNPQRVGKPLLGPLAGCHGAGRGTYRIVYKIDDGTRTVHVLHVAQQPEIYRRK
jgi:mRNA interferase RelE/StbE